MSSWFLSTGLFNTYFLIFCIWSTCWDNFVDAVNGNCHWDNSQTCYNYKEFCLSQCPTFWDATADDPHTCIQPDSSKRLIFNFHQKSSIIDDSNSPSIYTFTGPDDTQDDLSLPTLGYQRGLYFSSKDQFIKKNSGSILLSLSYTFIFWARVEGNDDELRFLGKFLNGDSWWDFTFNLLIADGEIMIDLVYCHKEFTDEKVLGDIGLTNPSWNLYKFVQTYYLTEYPLPVFSLKFWINDVQISAINNDEAIDFFITYDSPDYSLIIGSGFIGWLYELIYVPIVDDYTWPQDYIENLFSCPKSTQSSCLVSCKVNEFYDKNTQQCAACDSGCSNCVPPGQCGLCNVWCSSSCSETENLNSCDSNFCPTNSVMNVDTCICDDNAFYYDENVNKCLKCGIYLAYDDIAAGFSYDYKRVLFNFTVASEGSVNGCSNLFDSSVFSLFGNNPECKFSSDFTQLSIILGYGFVFGGGTVTFKSGVLKTLNKVCIGSPTQLSISVFLYLPSPTPKVTVLAPSEIIISCQDLILNGITYPGLPYEQYKWDFSSDNANSIIPSYSTPYNSIFTSISIPKNLLSLETITASLSVKNPFKIVTKTEKIILSMSPKIVINFDSSIPKTISRLKSYSLSISSIWACNEISEKLKISWSITSIANNLTNIDEKSLWENNLSSDVQLIMPPKVFPELTTITFHVHAYDYINKLGGDADLTIQTDSNSPVILFNRADGPIGVNQELVIDASDSYDPDGTSSTMLYQWICITNSIDCSNFIQGSSSMKLTVSENSLTIGEIYNFTLTITKTPSNAVQITNKSSRSIIITCISEIVSIINIYEINQVFNRPNSNEAYRLGIRGLSSTDTNLWALIKGPLIDISTPLNSKTLAIKEGSLIQGEFYTLQVLINDKFPFTWSFNVNQNPKGGILKATPDSGVEMSTIFTISALDWTDPDGDLPLQYSFGYYINNIYQALNAKNLTSIIYSQFPYSQEQIIFSVNIYDSLSAKTSVNSTLSVSLQEDLDTEQAIYNLTGKIFASTTPPSSIPLYVSQIAALSPNRQYLLNNSYSQINEFIQNSYDISINAIFRFINAMNPYDSDSSEAVGTMLNFITQNPYINIIDNIKRAGDLISSLKEKIARKSNLSNRDAQILVDVSNNEFQVHNDFVENSTDIVKEVDSNMIRINIMALEDMVIKEKKQFTSDKINVEISKQYVEELANTTETVKNSSIMLSPDIQNYLDGRSILGTSFINYDPIPNKENATLSIVSFNFIDLSTSAQISLKNISNQTIIISASNFDPEIIYSSPDPPKKPINSTTNNGTYIYTLNCSYLEDNDWKTEDCKLESYNQTHASCKCTRLGIFTAMVKAIWISFADNNAGDIINVSAFSDIDWDNAIGLYFVIGIIVFHSILSMKTLQMDWVKNSTEISEIESTKTVRPDESIVNYYLRNQSNDNSVTINIEDLKSEILKENNNQKIKTVLYDHEFIRIFVAHEEYSHFSLATIYSTLLLGEMFFIGLFYQNNNGNSNKGWSFNLKELIENYDFRDFWASVYATCFTFVLGIILNLLAKMKKIQYQYLEYPMAKKIEKQNKIKITIFYFLSYGLIIFFCWSIILFSIQFNLSISCKWVYNTALNFIVNILCVAFLKIALKVFIFWLLSKAWNMIRSWGKTKSLESQSNIASDEQDSPPSPQKLT